MIEQAEILEHDADPTADRGKVPAPRRRHVVAEERDKAARGWFGDINEFQQRRLAGARKTGQKGE